MLIKKKPLAIFITALVVLAAGVFIMQNTQETKNSTIVLSTTMGEIVIELDPTMPLTTNNFRSLVEKEFYNNTSFHRVISDFMIQGGDPTGTGVGGPGYTIKDEFGSNNHNLRGTIAMANAGPNTGGSQFFINVVDNRYLDDKHPVFGRVIKGMDVVDAISKVPTDASDRPLKDVKIVKASVR